MDLFKNVSFEITRGLKSRSSSCTETTLGLNIIESPCKQDSISKINHSELVNKFILIPEDIFTFGFNVLDIDDIFILRNIVCYIFKTFFERMNYDKINTSTFKNFIKDVSDNYKLVSYHNFYHATHILHTTYLLLDICGLFGKLNVDVLFATLLSALVHDIGHPGNNNIYEINTCSELACRYNDLSVLEQYHCHLAFELIKKNNLFINYSHDDFIVCRKTIISCILGTDMANHKSIQETMKLKKETGYNYELIEDQYLLARALLHAADIGNPIQDFQLCEAWARKVSLEFHHQVEKEKEKGLKPFTSFNINSTTSFYSHEIKYITYVCKPYWELFSDIFTVLKPLYNQININYDIYKSRLDELEQQYGLTLDEF
jgi:hypothetical protein